MTLEDLTGYKPMTTIFADLSIADRFGKNAVLDTYNVLFKAFKDLKYWYKEFTELVMMLNWKIWEHWEKQNQPLATLYNELWEKADAYACENMNKEQLEYFYNVTD